ncbi:prepilin peptidase-dependent protein [Erwinia sp. CPCC 100877]|nr:prepilin peptidase-dependent protein [Erwinia sp. CPCC 100877]
MSVTQRGFTLPELLIAIALASLIGLGVARLLPMLYLTTLNEVQRQWQQEDLWRLAFTLGKAIQRAGYCRRQCAEPGLWLTEQGRCLRVKWQGSNVQGFRLRNDALETLSGAADCQGKNWEKMTEPGSLKIVNFQVRRVERRELPPLFVVEIAGQPIGGGEPLATSYAVSGFNQ